MNRALFLIMMSCLAVSTIAAQGPVRSDPKQYKVAEVPWPGSVSSDGRYLAYVDEVDGDDQVFVRDVKTGESRRLTEGPGESGDFAIISPDGQYIAYNWVLGGSADALMELRVMRVDGSGQRVVHRENGSLLLHPRGWSPDGKHILANLLREDERYEFVLVSAGDGSVRVVKTLPLKTLNGRKPYNTIKLSPDGRYVAYEFPPQGNSPDRQIFVLSVDGGTEVPLLQHRSNDRLLDWTPDGTSLLFASDRADKWGFWAIQMLDGKPRGSPELVRAEAGLIDKGLGFTSDGSYYYSAPTWKNDVYVATLDPGTDRLQKPQKLVRHVGWATSVEWSPDGRHLSYVYGHGHQPDLFVLAVRSVATGKERRLQIHGLTRFGYHGFQAHWSPDGRSLVAAGRDKDYIGLGMDSQGLYRIDAQSGGVTPIIQTKSLCWPDCVEWPVWSAGGMVIYVRWVPQGIVARDLINHEEQEIYRVPEGDGGISQLAVSPDGRRIAFVSQKESVGLKVIATDGGEPRELLRLQKPEVISALAWTPDSRHIIYAVTIAGEKQEFDLRRVSADGGKPEYMGLRMKGLLPYSLSVHPDGRRIAFTAGTPFRSEIWVLKDFLPEEKPGKQ